eukprot:335489-Amphidinium_carterae.1
MLLAAAAETPFCFFASIFSGTGVCQFHWFASVTGIGGGGGGGGGGGLGLSPPLTPPAAAAAAADAAAPPGL